MGNDFEKTAAICAQMMMWRKVTLIMAIPFICNLLGSFAWGRLTDVSSTMQSLLCIAFIPQPPLLVYLFRLANKVHGVRYAVLHAVLTAILTPFFLIGPLLIPLLVLGDVRRLLLDDDSGK